MQSTLFMVLVTKSFQDPTGVVCRAACGPLAGLHLRHSGPHLCIQNQKDTKVWLNGVYWASVPSVIIELFNHRTGLCSQSASDVLMLSVIDSLRMDSPGILVVEVYSYSGVPWATEYLYITSYLCPSAPCCQCFVDTDSFIVRPDIASAAIYCCKRSSQFAVNMNRYCRWYKRHIQQRIFRRQHRCLANLNFVLHDELYAKIDFAWWVCSYFFLLCIPWGWLISYTYLNIFYGFKAKHFVLSIHVRIFEWLSSSTICFIHRFK